MTSVVMQADDLFFNEREVREVYNKVVNMLWNVVTFYLTYAGEYDGKTRASDSTYLLDRWILAKTNLLVKDVTDGMDHYDTVRAGRPIKEFIEELSTWYLRRSRDRFKGSASAKATADKDNEADKQAALATLREVLLTLAKVMAPFTPFLAEKIYQEVGKTHESVHLEAWPTSDASMAEKNNAVLAEMDQVRKIVEMGLALRAEAGVRVRQVLGRFSVAGASFSPELKQIVADELNVKDVAGETGTGGAWKEKADGGVTVALNIEITEELKKEGLAREIVRTINQMRKDMNLTVADRIVVSYETNDDLLRAVFHEYGNEIRRQVLAQEITFGAGTC